MNIYKNVECLDNKKYDKSLFFKKSKLPLFLKILKNYFPDLSEFFQTTYSRPLMIICETVNICCNDCIICPYGKMTRKKEIMPLKVFEKVLVDYSDMGGGKLSLTPKNGDIFFDKFLLERLNLIKKYPKISGISVTTNAILSDQFTDEELIVILQSFERIHISIYGIDEEEYSLMTRRGTYFRMIKNIQRIINLSNNQNSIVFGFRFLKMHTTLEIDRWIEQHFCTKIPYSQTNIYMDWGGSIDSAKPLPFKGEWRRRKEGLSQCLIPLSACIIYSSGDVSFCSCNDYDIKDEFLLGNISKQSLGQILNSSKNRRLWASPTNLPESCKKCVSHRPFTELGKYEFMFENPINFIGG